MPLVGVVMGSKSDEPYVKETLAILENLGVDHEVNIMSAIERPSGQGNTASQLESEASRC